jgi:replicative DNA helicase
MKPAHYAPEAEDMVIGVFAEYPDTWPTIQTELTEEDFYQPKARRAFAIAAEIDRQRNPVDGFTVSEFAIRTGEPEVAVYVQECATQAIGRASIKSYCRVVREKKIERDLMSLARWQFNLATSSEPLGERLAQVQEKAYALGKRHVVSADEVSAIADDVLRELATRDGSKLVGINSGFRCIDDRWGGLRNGALIVLAGRPAMGKTTLAINIAEHVAINGYRVLVFSLEMGSAELVEKIISSQAGVFYADLSTGEAFRNHVQIDRVQNTMPRIKGMDMVINSNGGITMSQIRAESRRHSGKKRVDLIVIDYLQLINGNPKHSAYERISEITRGMKQMAVELNCPVILLSQLNRKCDERPYGSNQPVMSDLRDSGTIEQDADLVAFVYRDVVYNEHTMSPHIAELITAKNRKGVPGTDYMRAELDRSRFADHEGPKPQYISVEEPKRRREF